jgi:hypothetical protein
MDALFIDSVMMMDIAFILPIVMVKQAGGNLLENLAVLFL